jgi:hypothetical protein
MNPALLIASRNAIAAAILKAGSDESNLVDLEKSGFGHGHTHSRRQRAERSVLRQ